MKGAWIFETVESYDKKGLHATLKINENILNKFILNQILIVSIREDTLMAAVHIADISDRTTSSYRV